MGCIEYSHKEEDRPFTAVQWRPKLSSALMKNVFIGVNSDGVALHCHSTSSKIIHESKIEGVQFHSVGYNLDGTSYAIGCDDNTIKIFDETTKTQS